MSLETIFAGLATGFAEQFGAPYIEATAVWPGEAIKDAGGSITTPANPVTKACRAQFDAATQAMRASEGFLETDVRILVLAASIDGALDSNARIIVATGPNAGTWSLLTCQRDPAGIGYECRGRRVG
jgi:hypothetical protein